jgi:hypothetical protein
MSRPQALIILAIWAVATTLTGCGSIGPDTPASPTAAVVVVDAIDADTKASIPVEAVATCGGVSGIITLTEGSVVLRDVPFGTGTPPNQPLTVSAPGYVTFAEPIQISMTVATFYTATMTKADPNTTGSVGGKVTDVATGLPIASALARFIHADAGGTKEVRAYTDNLGNYLCRGIPIGTDTVVFEAPGYVTDSVNALVIQEAGGQSANVDMAMIPGTTTISVSGLVYDVFSDVNLPGATVTLAGLLPVTTNAGGTFSIANVPVGSQALLVHLAGYDDYSAQVNILPGMGVLRVGMIITSATAPTGPYNLQGTVTLNGRPDNSGATVTAVDLNSSLELGREITPPSGEYLMFLPPGSYRITVTYGAVSLHRDVVVPRGGRVLRGISFILSV